tara:strand:- start:132 stop:257 length:126 start_codon:yes stop_codon:yes gene_type:complete
MKIIIKDIFITLGKELSGFKLKSKFITKDIKKKLINKKFYL